MVTPDSSPHRYPNPLCPLPSRLADVNEVIQRFLLQEETHQAAVDDAREPGHIDELTKLVEEERAVMAAEYSVGAGDEAASNQDTDSAQMLAAQKALAKARERWRKVLKTSVNTKSAVRLSLTSSSRCAKRTRWSRRCRTRR